MNIIASQSMHEHFIFELKVRKLVINTNAIGS